MHIESFITYLEKQKRYSAHTVRAYKNDLLQFQAYLDKNYPQTDMAFVKSSIIRSWFSEMALEGISPRTLRRKKTVLQNFYRYLIKNNVTKKNPLLHISGFKLSKNLPHFVQKDQILSVITSPVDENLPFHAARDLMIFKMLYATGMRVSEITNLKNEDVDESRQILKVRGKRNKERFIPLHENFIKEFKIYQQIKRNFFVERPVPEWLFLTDKGQKIYPRMIYRIVSNYLSIYTKSTKKNPHVLRHTLATHLLQEGADLNSIKELLGHANLSATQIYTHTNITHLKKVYEKFHPKS